MNLFQYIPESVANNPMTFCVVFSIGFGLGSVFASFIVWLGLRNHVITPSNSRLYGLLAQKLTPTELYALTRMVERQNVSSPEKNSNYL